MFRKIAVPLLCISLILSAPGVFRADSSEATDLAVILEMLKEKKALVGDEDGNLRLDDPVTRAEFCKMTRQVSWIKFEKPRSLAASWYKQEDDGSYTYISPGSNSSDLRFLQVVYTALPAAERYTWDLEEAQQWYWPYINEYFHYKLVSGYPDGTIRPKASIVLEESVAIALRNMGYDSSTLDGDWPNNVLDRANSLSLLENVATKQGESISRRDCAYLLYNIFSKETSYGAPYTDTYLVDSYTGVRYSIAMLWWMQNGDGRYVREGEESEVQEFVNGIIANAQTDRERARKIADWVATHMAYNEDFASADYWRERMPDFDISKVGYYYSTKSPYISLYDALIAAKDYPLFGICHDYTALYEGLLRIVGIANKNILGANHEFNIVWLKDEQIFIFVDTTWMSSFRLKGGVFYGGDRVNPWWFDLPYGCDDRHTSPVPLLDVEY